MNIQSLSIVVPNLGCINKCPFCISRMVNSNTYPNKMDINDPQYDINVREYLNKLRFVADNGCQTLILTGTSEPQQNRQFLATFALLHQQIGSPFTNIEMQTTGVTLENNRNYLRFLRNFVGVNTVALSVNALCNEMNNRIIGQGGKTFLTLENLCEQLKEYGFNIRICCNLTSLFDLDRNPLKNVFEFINKNLRADQVTFRKMYSSSEDTEQGKWLSEHQFPDESMKELENYINKFPVIGKTMYGSPIHDILGMSVICDGDCMGKNPETDVKKYLILRPNCHLYSQWDTKASLIN